MSEDLIRGLARRLFQNLPADDFERLRYRVIDWLLRDGIHPDEFADACESDPESKYRTLGQKIRSDLSLRIVWLAVDVSRGQRH
ncbi:hypothetical protein BH11PLA2_BH11PLA2_47100 [soil metagenome]